MAEVRSQEKPEAGRTDRRTATDGNRNGQSAPVDEHADEELRDTAVERPPEPATEEQPDEAAEPHKPPFYKRPKVLLAALVLLLLGVIFGFRYWLYARAHESTDDAFIDGNVVQISSKVSGYVAKVYVTDNQQVKAGELLVEIDPRDYETRLAQAKAALETGLVQQQQAQTGVALTRATTQAAQQQANAVVQQARSGVQSARAAAAAERTRVNQAAAGITAAQANVQQARAQVTAAQAEAARANADVGRYQQLYERDEVSRQRLDQAIAAATTATAQLNAARQRVSAAEAQLNEARSAQATAAENARRAEAQTGTAQAQVGEALGRLSQANTAPQQIAVNQAQVATATANIEQLRAQVRQAELQLSYTKIYAPTAGRVTNKNVQTGALIQPSQPLLALVTSDLWVTANFKENQIGQIQQGQPVTIKVDAYPNHPFRGHVDSIQAGSGAAFSLLPPENATGNYVKVVQRVPVKIVFDEPLTGKYVLGPGMSVVPEVKVK
jgi:membrane fusion protein (multidrug efflux system)